MKIKTKLIALLALTGIGLAAPAANAATTAYIADDLILGFRQDGNAFTYLVNIGQASTYRDLAAGAPTTSFNVSGLGNIGADLVSVFGADWFAAAPTNGTVYWGVVGTPGATSAGGDLGSTLYATKPESVLGTPETGYLRNNTSAQGIPRQAIVSMIASYQGQTSTANNNVGYAQPASTTNGWAANTSSGIDFGYFSGLEGSSPLSTSALDLFRMAAKGCRRCAIG